jgi:hypothetical protein
LVCYTCGREGHTSPQCYARTHVFDSDGEFEESDEDSESE